MGRRTVLLVVAALIAALGSAMVFLYVRGADNRAEAAQAPVQVLKAVTQINAGESLDQAQAAGKLQLGTVPRTQVLTGAMNSIGSLGRDVALSTVYPGEQIITAKFGSPGEESALTLPKGDIAISVNLSDTGRVAGFVSPGSNVAIFRTGGDTAMTRMLLPKVEVVAVGSTTVVSTTTTDASGAQTTEQLPKTLFTLAVNQSDAEKVIFASQNGDLSFGLLNDKSKVKPDAGVSEQNLFR